MARKNNDYYYDSFYQLMDYPCLGAKVLASIMEDIEGYDMHEKLIEVHAIEHDGDVAKYEVTKRLVNEFITPIEREDIVMLLAQIDDIMDAIEDVVRLLSMYNIKHIKEDAKAFIPIITQSCAVLKETILEFKQFRKSKTIKKHFLKLNELEEKADLIHYQAIKKLYQQSKDPIEIFTWTNIFEALENCCDQFKEVSELIEMIMLKNT